MEAFKKISPCLDTSLKFGQNIVEIFEALAEVLALPLCNLVNLSVKQSTSRFM